MSQWYFNYDGQQMGPMETEQAIQQVQRNPNGYACWLQSPPFSRLAGRMLRAAPQSGGSSEEDSVLGTLGNRIGGDL
jgi:hypothetical protein